MRCDHLLRSLLVAGFVSGLAACARRDSRQTETARTTSAAGRGQTAGALEAAANLVHRAVRGEGLAANPCIGRDTIKCGSLTVVSSVSIDSEVQARGDTALVTARYTALGTLAPVAGGLRFVADLDSARRLVVDTLRLVRGAGGWRTVDSVSTRRILARIAMYYFDLVDGARASIAGMSGLDWSSAVRLVLTAPAALTQLPSPVRDTLGARGCSVLQRRGRTTDNVVRGAFYDDSGGDWAVLCARRSDGTILVFSSRGGSPAELVNVGGRIPDVNALPKPDDYFIYGCAPSIDLVHSSGRRRPLPGGEVMIDDDSTDTLTKAERLHLANDGINSADCEGVSNVYYWTGRRWVRFPGAD